MAFTLAETLTGSKSDLIAGRQNRGYDKTRSMCGQNHPKSLLRKRVAYDRKWRHSRGGNPVSMGGSKKECNIQIKLVINKRAAVQNGRLL